MEDRAKKGFTKKGLELDFKVKAAPGGSLALVLTAATGDTKPYIEEKTAGKLVGKTARWLFEADQFLVDGWMDFMLEAGAKDGERCRESLDFLQATKSWVYTRLVHDGKAGTLRVCLSPPQGDAVQLELGQLMELKQGLWLADYVCGGGSWEMDLKADTIRLSRPMAQVLQIADDTAVVPIRDFLALVDPRDLPSVQGALDNVQAKQRVIYNRGVMKDGSMLHFDSFAIPGYDEKGQVDRIIGYSRNVTEARAVTQQLELNERRMRGILENTPDIFVVMDFSGVIRYISPNAGKLTGYAPEKITGRNAREFLPVKSEESKLMSEFASVRGFGAGTEGEYRIALAGGGEAWYSVRMSLIGAPGDKTSEIVAVCRDITQERARNESMRYMTAHDALTGAYNRQSFEAELERIEDGGVREAGLVLTDLNGLKLVNDAFGTAKGDELLVEAYHLLHKAVAGRHAIYRVGGDEFAILAYYASDGELERICAYIESESKKTQDRSVPLSLSWGTGYRPDSSVSMQALYKQAESRMYANKLLDSRSMRSHVLASLKEALRMRNLETADHTQRMENMVMALGRRLGLSGDDSDRLVLLASMHDIGKVAIPDHIINKPGPLSQEEWTVMRTHAEVGARIAATSQELLVIAEEIGSHHERWDGKGYPAGKKGEEIPLLARIINVVDTYDVMTHKRVYKEAQDHKTAIEELRRCRGTQFDPKIADLFLEIFGEFSEEEMERFTAGGC